MGRFIAIAVAALCVTSAVFPASAQEFPGREPVVQETPPYESAAPEVAQSSAVSGPEAAVPDQWMTRGAGVLPKGRYGFMFSAGLPSAEARVVIPVNDFLEVNPVVRFGYVYGIWLAFNPSIAAGAELKFRVLERGGDDVALAFGVLAQLYCGSGLAWDVWLGGLDIRYSHRWNNPFIGVLAGFRVSVSYGWIMEIPIEVYVGLEGRVAPHVTLHLTGNAGANPLGGGTGVVLAGFQFGVSYVW